LELFHHQNLSKKNSYLHQEMKRWKRHSLLPTFKLLRKKRKGLKIMYHNIQSLKKHVMLVQNDKNFTSQDILLFGETWLKHDEAVTINGYSLVSQTALPFISKPQGVAIFVKNDIVNKVINPSSAILKDKSGRIDMTWITINKKTIIAVYSKPKSSLQLWNKFFKTISLVNKRHVIIMGDININSKNKRSFSKFQPLLEKYNLHLANKKMISTHKNTALDWIITDTPLSCGRYASYFSYHHPVWACKIYSHFKYLSIYLSISLFYFFMFFCFRHQ